MNDLGPRRGFKLPHVLQHNDAGSDFSGPSNHNPGQAPALIADWLAAFGFAVVRAIGTEPGQAHFLAFGELHGIHAEDVFDHMMRVGMVNLVHSQCVIIPIAIRNRIPYFSRYDQGYEFLAANGFNITGDHQDDRPAGVVLECYSLESAKERFGDSLIEYRKLASVN